MVKFIIQGSIHACILVYALVSASENLGGSICLGNLFLRGCSLKGIPDFPGEKRLLQQLFKSG